MFRFCPPPGPEDVGTVGIEATKGCISSGTSTLLAGAKCLARQSAGGKTGGAAVVERTGRELHGGQVLLHDYG